MDRTLGYFTLTLLGVAVLSVSASGQPLPQLWTPRPLFSGEIPLPDQIAQADLVVLGRVVALEDKTEVTKPFSDSPHKIAYRVAVVKVSEVLLGDKAVKEYRLGFIPPESYKRTTAGVPTVSIPLPQTSVFEVGQEGLFILKKHHQENFYVKFALNGGFRPGDALTLGKGLENARRLADIVKRPVQALQDENAANRYLAAAMMIRSYRPAEVKGRERQEVAIDADESKLLLKTLAEADWKYDADTLSRIIYPAHPYRLFMQLGVSAADGYTPPAAANDVRETLAATRRWVQENQQKYRIKRIVPQAKR